MRILRMTAWMTLATCICLSSHAALPSENLVGLWRFDETEGDIARDLSGMENHGRLMNGPRRVGGKYGQALQFEPDVVANRHPHVEIPDARSLNPTEQITLCAWVYVKDTIAARQILQKSTAGKSDQYRVYVVVGTKTVFCDVGPGPATRQIAAKLRDFEAWQHLAFVYDGQTLSAYVNGQLQATANATGTLVLPSLGTAPLRVGSPNPMNGMIDELAIFDVALTETQIREVIRGFEVALPVGTKGMTVFAWARLKSGDH